MLRQYVSESSIDRLFSEIVMISLISCTDSLEILHSTMKQMMMTMKTMTRTSSGRFLLETMSLTHHTGMIFQTLVCLLKNTDKTSHA